MKSKGACTLSILLLIAVSISAAIAQSPDEIDERVSRLVEEYMNTKDGLVHNRHDLAEAWAVRLETSIATTPNDIFGEDGDEPLSIWQGIQGAMMDGVGGVIESEDLAGQRDGLLVISEQLWNLIQEFGNPGETLYVISCDTYADEEVVWLNDSPQVANPYHGPENSGCGEVIAEL